jgi:hypothetical protein
MSVSINGTSGLTFNDGSAQTTAASGFGFKNRIINSAMVIDQRNAGASVTGGVLVYTLDRYVSFVQTDGVMTFQRVADAPTGFTYSLKATTTTADASLGATQRAAIFQRIEGFNVADFALGSASAVQFTLSFWVKSTLTGTFGGSFQNNDSNRAYPFTYTISAANTWEQKTVTITGDTTGTWNTTTGTGLQVVWGLGVGSTYSGTAGSWSANDYNSATGGTSVIGTLNATWQVTGVQLEKGSTATSFDYRPYGTELALCQRYAIVYGRDQAYNEIGGTGFAYGTTAGDVPVSLPVQMRTTPTLSTSGNFQISDGAAATAITSLSIITAQSSTQIASIRFNVASGATTFRPYRIETNNSTTATATFSAEL